MKFHTNVRETKKAKKNLKIGTEESKMERKEETLLLCTLKELSSPFARLTFIPRS